MLIGATACAFMLACVAANALAGPAEDAARFLESFDPAIALEAEKAGCSPEKTLSAAAADAGVALSSLGENWYARFVRGEFRPGPGRESGPADTDGDYVCEDPEWVCFAMPLEKGAEGAGTEVSRDGKTLSRKDFRIEPAPDGKAFLVFVRNTGGFHKGALVTARIQGGRLHAARRPPDEIDLSCETEIARGSETTRITMKPVVRQTDPAGNDKSPPPGKGPGGEGGTDVSVKDDSGFFEDLFKLLGNAAVSMGIGLGTGVLLSELTSGGGGKNVSRNPADGSYSMEVPNDAYDQSMNSAKFTGPDAGNQTVAESGKPVVMESRAEGGAKGLRIVSYWAVGGSVYSLKAGQTVVFRIEGCKTAPALREVTVRLLENGSASGFMSVLSASTTGGVLEVSAKFPSMASTYSGDLEACVQVGGDQSDRVPLKLSPGTVTVSVSDRIVKSGSTVRISLHNASGGGIKGTLSISGPAHFLSNGGKSVKIDTRNCREDFTAATTSAGTVDIKFEKG